MRIGLLTDSHIPSDRKALFDEVRAAFAGVDLILHGGDIITPGVLDWLEETAPVLAARGNNDGVWGDSRVRDVQVLEFAGWRLVMLHDMEPEERPLELLWLRYPEAAGADILVTGHTHYERIDYRQGVLQVNSGSPTHPHNYSTRLGTVGVLDLRPGQIDAEIVRLGESPGLRNPGEGLRFSSVDGLVRQT
jgi:putative phosphoesterase